MSSVVQRPSHRSRLRDGLLRISWRILFSRVGRAVVLSPLIVVRYYAHVCLAAFGPRPEVEIDPGSTVTPEMAQFLTPDNKRFFALIQEARRVPKRTEITERERVVAQTMTWGMAGAAVVIVTAIATSSKTFNGPAIARAAIVFLVACYLGKRAFNNLVFHRLPPLVLTNAPTPTQTAPEGSSQPGQVAGDTSLGPA